MGKVKLVFFILMVILACVIFVTPLFFPEKKSGKENNSRRIRTIVRIRMGCFLAMLVLLFLCVVLPNK